MSQPSFREPIIVADRSVPLAHVSVSTESGALLDPENKEGATRLLMRLMRRSVEGLTSEELDIEIDRLGGSLGVEIGRTVAGFHGGVIARNRDAFFELLARVLKEPAFDEVEFARLVGEAQAEWVESLDNDSALALRIFSRNFFEGHPYARASGGTPESLARISLDDLRSLYQRHFTNQLQFGFAGDVQSSELSAFVSRTVNALSSAPSTSQESTLPEPSGPVGRKLLFVDKPLRTQSQVLVGCLGSHPGDEDHTALYVGHTIFGGTFSGRLSREVRGKRGWSYGAYSNLPFDKQRQSFYLYTFPQASDTGKCLSLKLDLLSKFIDKGVTPRELSAAKKYLINSHVFAVDTAAKRASLALDELAYGLPENYYKDLTARVRDVTLEEVNAAIQKRLSAKNLLITVLGTATDILSEVEAAVPELAASTQVQFDAKS